MESDTRLRNVSCNFLHHFVHWYCVSKRLSLLEYVYYKLYWYLLPELYLSMITQKIVSYYKHPLEVVKIAHRNRQPVSILGPYDWGQHFLFRMLSAECPVSEGYRYIDAQSTVNFEIPSIQPLTYIIDLISPPENVDWMRDLYAQRNLHSTAVNWVILSSHGLQYRAYAEAIDQEIFRKVCLMHPCILPTATEQECMEMLDNYSALYGPLPHATDAKKICSLSEGYVGILKVLYLVATAGKLADWKQDQGVKDRATQLLADYPVQYAEALTKGKVLQASYASYLDTTLVRFTPSQQKIIQLLLQKYPDVVTRDALAQAIWGAKWTEKYSDYALDRHISTMRDIAKGYGSLLRFVGVRGVGYKLAYTL